MSQKLVIAGLALAIIAVMGFGLYDASRNSEDDDTVSVGNQAIVVPTTAPVATGAPTADTQSANTEPTAPEVTPLDGTQTNPVVQALDTMGEDWQGIGTVTTLEDFGFTLVTAFGDFYVELGPPTYWQSQPVTLVEGETVVVTGYYNGEQVHARIVSVNNQELVIRNENGQPMWSGGMTNTTLTADGTTTAGAGQLQVNPEDWVTLYGVIGAVTNGNVVLNVDDGTILNLQMGQPQFWQSQGVTLSIGDPVEVLGFWSGTQFMVGDILKTDTGELIMLRDPNGRQLWAGPGRTGNGNGNGRQGNQHLTPTVASN